MTSPVWIDVPGNIAHNEPIDFTLAVEPISITLEYLTDPDPALNEGDWPTVYDDGRFSHRFATSSRDGTHWTIRPPGGTWGGVPFRVHVNPAFSGYGGAGIAGNLAPIYNPWAWYVLDPINRLVDQSGHGHTLTEIDAADIVAGPGLGYVASKAGKLRYSGAEVAEIRVAGGVSFVALFHRDTISATPGCWIVGAEHGGAAWGTWWKFGVESDGRLMYGADRGGPPPLEQFVYLADVGDVPASEWCVVAGTISDDGLTVKGYVNKVLTGTHTNPGVPFGSSGAWLFAMQDYFQTPTNHRQMVIAVWTDELNAATIGEITDHLLGVAVLFAPLAFYKLDGAPDTAKLRFDSSGNARHLTAGTADPATDLIAGRTAAAPIAGDANRLKRSVDPALQLRGAMTITMRVKWTSGDGGLACLSAPFAGGAANRTLYVVSITAAGKLRSYLDLVADNVTTAGLTSGEWHFISFRRAEDLTETLGIDNTFEVFASRGAITDGSSSYLVLGDQEETGDLHLNGAMADVRIWGRALTDEEIALVRDATMA